MRNRAGNTRPGFTFFGGLAGAALAADPLIEVRSVPTLGGEAALPARFRSAHARAGPGHPFTSSARSSLPGSSPSSQPTKHHFSDLEGRGSRGLDEGKGLGPEGAPLADSGSTPGAQAPITSS